MDGSILKEKQSLKILVLSLSPKLDWGSYIVSIAKTVSKKIETLISCMKFLSPEVGFYFFKSTVQQPCMEHCFRVCAGVSRCLLGKLDKLQKRVYKIVGFSFTSSLEPLP